MLSLKKQSIDLDYARKVHIEFFKPLIHKRIINKTDFLFFYNFLNNDDNLEKLILGEPQELIDLNEIFIQLVNNEFGNNSYQTYIELSKKSRAKCTAYVSKFFKRLQSVINYNDLSNNEVYTSYSLTSNLGIRSCVYCNRTYTLTKRKKSKGRLMNPQLDHWFPQSKFPLLQISFHNLIPSCEICNSRVKNSTPFDLQSHFHPYNEVDNSEHLCFNYKLGVKDKYSVFFDSKSTDKIKRTCEEMYVDDMYDAHQYELDDLIKIRQAYSQKYLETLRDIFPETKLSESETYRLVFGTELNKKDFHRRPMSKFKYDILKEIGIITD